jgi:hypothetical protein
MQVDTSKDNRCAMVEARIVDRTVDVAGLAWARVPAQGSLSRHSSIRPLKQLNVSLFSNGEARGSASESEYCPNP